MYRKKGVKRGKVRRKEKTRGVKTFSEPARPRTSAYVCLGRHRVRAHPASSAAIKLPFPTVPITNIVIVFHYSQTIASSLVFLSYITRLYGVGSLTMLRQLWFLDYSAAISY